MLRGFLILGGMKIASVENKMNVQDQDKGLKHCHYIRQLANEIWLKDNAGHAVKKITWNEAIKLALELHVKKLRSTKPKIVPVKPLTTGYNGWGW